MAETERRNAALERQLQYLRTERDKVQGFSLDVLKHRESYSGGSGDQKATQLLKEQQVGAPACICCGLGFTHHTTHIDAFIPRLYASTAPSSSTTTTTTTCVFTGAKQQAGA